MTKPRKLPPEVAEIRKRYTSLSKAGRKYMAYLEIDHQTFPICVEYTTKARAEWFRDMLAIALRRLISHNMNYPDQNSR